MSTVLLCGSGGIIVNKKKVLTIVNIALLAAIVIVAILVILGLFERQIFSKKVSKRDMAGSVTSAELAAQGDDAGDFVKEYEFESINIGNATGSVAPSASSDDDELDTEALDGADEPADGASEDEEDEGPPDAGHTDEDTQEYYDDDGTTYGDYIIDYSSSSYLDESDLAGLSAKELTYARNEIYARHGYVFKSSELNAYFGMKSWYSPSASNDYIVLSSVEQANVDFINAYQNSHGLTYKPS